MALTAFDGGAETLTLDLWLWPLTADAAHLESLAAHLSAAERARADGFTKPDDSAAFILARGRLREILGGSLGCAPREVPLTTGAHGRPQLDQGADGHGPAFNLSHAGGWAALVTGPHGLPLGIDIEPHRPIEPDLPARFFSPAEQAELGRLTGADWTAGFFNAWTRKEALVKALGAGLTRPLDSFDVSLTPGAPARLLRLSGAIASRWRLIPLELRPDFPGCIAVRHPEEAGEVKITLREGELPLPG